MQTWNDILEYVNINLGANINIIEISEEEILGLLKRQVLPYFSQYAPDKKYVLINTGNLIEFSSGQPQYRYKIPKDSNDYIIDIYDVYITNNTEIIDALTYNYYGAIDAVMANSYIDAIQSLGVRNTWEYRPPDTLIFDEEVLAAIVVYNTNHVLLETIRPDLYHLAFKPLCLANLKLWLASMRNKYEGLNTPFGQIMLNWQQLQQEGLQEKEKIETFLSTIPPDKLIEVSV